MTFTTLRDKATLVKLTQRSLGTTKREKTLTANLQQSQNDTGLVVLSKLFNDKNNPVNAALRMTTELYSWHRTHTLPYADAGPRLLPNTQYMNYTKGIGDRKIALADWIRNNLGNYDLFVKQDLAYRRGKGVANSNAHPDDYPSADRLERSLSPVVVFEPLPDTSHFLFDLDPEDKQNFENMMTERFDGAQRDAVSRIMEPLEKLIKKLDEYQGAAEERFHASLVSNVIEGARLAKELTLEGSTQYFDKIEEVTKLVNSVSVDSLRENASYRDTVKSNLEDVQSKMVMFAP
jgi:hypothetical protein